MPKQTPELPRPFVANPVIPFNKVRVGACQPDARWRGVPARTTHIDGMRRRALQQHQRHQH